jgi:hypothetical protein
LRDRYAQIAQQQSHGFALMGERLKQRILTPTA